MPKFSEEQKNFINGKQVIVTGANRGIGRETTKQLAGMGAEVIMACRDVDHASKERENILREIGGGKITVMKLDLADKNSIIMFSEEFKKKFDYLDVLINNAGLQSSTKKLNKSGIELAFSVNAVGHQILTNELLESLKKSAPSRIINVASDFAGKLDLNDINFNTRSYSSNESYMQTKQANRMLTREWARRLKKENVWVNSMSPGLTPDTDLFRELPGAVKILLKILAFFVGNKIPQAADTVVWLAVEPTLEGVTGEYFVNRKNKKCKFNNPEKERKLWDLVESLY